MQLKLADYGEKKEKFERFLELGEDFFYGNSSIYIQSFLHKIAPQFIQKDEKDPLNRFNGLFDGRTYGEGRFILVYPENYHPCDGNNLANGKFNYSDFTDEISEEIDRSDYDKFCPSFLYKKLGNLHQQPELWGKLKTINVKIEVL